MDYLRLYLQLPDDLHELLIAELFDLDFDGFEQEDNLLIASITSAQYDDTKRETIERILFGIEGAELLKEELVKPQNWNEQWEQSIQPQSIGRFYVRPTWSKPLAADSNLIELFIDPKMAFGTGYHATTRLILEILEEVIEEDDEVLDAGTGTGILGIAALKLGAKSVFGFDIDEWSEQNANENILLNQVQNFEVRHGSLEQIPVNKQYDIILANINRNALITLLPDLCKHLKKSGKILLSGLLDSDEEIMLSVTDKLNLSYQFTRQQSEWIAILLKA